MMPDRSDLSLSDLSEWFKALSDETRLRILILLKNNELSVNEIVNKLGLAQTSVSKQLGLLKRAGILESRREGTKIYYSMKSHVAIRVCELVCDDLISKYSESQQGISKLDFQI